MMRKNKAIRLFTMTELMIASSVGTMAMAMVMTFWVGSAKLIRSGNKQLIFHSTSRMTSHALAEYIQNGKSVGNESGEKIYITNPDGTGRYVYFHDADGEEATIGDNYLVTETDDGNYNGDSSEEIIGRYISKIDSSTPIFTTETPGVRIRFHVGDIIDGSSDNQTGKGIQGVDVRLYFTCRNKTKEMNMSE